MLSTENLSFLFLLSASSALMSKWLILFLHSEPVPLYHGQARPWSQARRWLIAFCHHLTQVLWPRLRAREKRERIYGVGLFSLFPALWSDERPRLKPLIVLPKRIRRRKCLTFRARCCCCCRPLNSYLIRGGSHRKVRKTKVSFLIAMDVSLHSLSIFSPPLCLWLERG